MTKITIHKEESLDRYQLLIKNHPTLFLERKRRRIIQDIDILNEYSASEDIVLGVVAVTPYVYFVVDLVEVEAKDHSVHRYPYLRVISLGQLKGGHNVVVLGIIKNSAIGEVGSVVLVTQERHATGTMELEVPRGFAEPGLSGEENALKELFEETGYFGDEAFLLGETYTDTGLTDSKVAFYYIPITKHSNSEQNTVECISNVSVMSLKSIYENIESGVIRDGFTVQALSLYNMKIQSKQ